MVWYETSQKQFLFHAAVLFSVVLHSIPRFYDLLVTMLVHLNSLLLFNELPHIPGLCFSAVSISCVWCLQLSLAEVLGLAAAVESCSEHPLAAAVLHFAAAHLAVPQASLDAELTAGLHQLEEPSEASQLLPSPSKAQRQTSPTVTATDWLQPATDVEVEEGEHHFLFAYPVQHQPCPMCTYHVSGCRGALLQVGGFAQISESVVKRRAALAFAQHQWHACAL